VRQILGERLSDTLATPAAAPYPAVSRSSPLPLYHQVKTDIRHRIERREWSAGHRIPSEAELCANYGASRITIRRAIGDLAAEGMLLRVSGRGTYVREPTVTAGQRGLTSFTQEMGGLGLRVGARLLRSTVEPAAARVAERLSVSEGEPVVVIARLRTGDGRPIGIQTAHLAARRFPGLERAELGDGSLYGHLSRAYGFVPAEAEEIFEVGPIRRRDADLLEVRPGTCGFLVQRLTYDIDGRPAEYVTAVMRGDRYRIHIGLRSPAHS
jgi:GntR family transcriptional regulator